MFARRPWSVKHLLVRPLLFVLAIPMMQGCSCGFDCNSDDNSPVPATSLLTLGLSDEALEDLKQVVIEVDSVTLVGSGSDDDVTIETFTIDELGLVDADSFQLDLLQYRGRQQLLVLQGLEVATGTYSAVTLRLLDDDVNFSYVQEADDSLKAIIEPSGGLRVPGFTLRSATEQYTIEFSLAQSLQYRSASDDYLLSAEGVRTQDTAESASISGRVDSSLFDTVEPCSSKTEPTAGNRLYLYSGQTLSGTLADVYTDNSASTVPDDAIAPYAVATLLENSLTGNWEYILGYLPEGDYTLVFSCDAADDDPVEYDGITIPLPADQLYEISLSASEQATCDLAVNTSCR